MSESKVGITEAVLQQRKSTHGTYNVFARVEQDMKYVLHNSPKWNTMSHAQRSALEACVGKIARIVTGDPYFLDSWRDIIGYATRGFEFTAEDNRATDVEQTVFKVKEGVRK